MITSLTANAVLHHFFCLELISSLFYNTKEHIDAKKVKINCGSRNNIWFLNAGIIPTEDMYDCCFKLGGVALIDGSGIIRPCEWTKHQEMGKAHK